MIQTDYEFFRVEPQPQDPRKKTKTYYLVNHRSGTSIATIEWYGAWRQFCFFPMENTVWSDGCMADVREIIRAVTIEYGQSKGGTRHG